MDGNKLKRKKSIRLKIEKECTECEGSGKVGCGPCENVLDFINCSDCDGSGWVEEYVSIEDFMRIIEYRVLPFEVPEEFFDQIFKLNSKK